MKHVILLAIILLSAPAWALGLGSLGLGFTKGTAESSPYLDGQISGVLAQYSGLSPDSADGTGETWLNLLGNTAWDLETTAITTTPPVWSSSKKRWVANHGGAFVFSNQSGPVEFLNAHRNTNGNPLTIVWYGFHKEPEAGGVVGGPENASGKDGFNIYQTNVGPGRYNLTDGSSGGSSVSVLANLDNDEASESIFMIVSIDPTSTTDNVKIWKNSRTGTTNSFTFTSDDPFDSIAAVWAYTTALGALAGTVNDGIEIQELAFIDHVLTDQEASKVIDFYKDWTGEPIALDDVGTTTGVEYLVIYMQNPSNTQFWPHDLAVRDAEGNDLIPSLSDSANQTSTTRNEVAGKLAGYFTNPASRIDAFNDAAWNSGDNPVANPILNGVSVSSETNLKVIRFNMEFSEPVDLGSIAYYLDNAATNYPTTIKIYTQDGLINSLLTFPSDVDDYVYTDGGDKRAYEITVD